MSRAEVFFKTHVRSFARSGDVGSLKQQLLIITAVLVFAALILMGSTVSNLQHSLRDSEATENTILEITTIESRLLDYSGNLVNLVDTGDSLFAARMENNRKDTDVAVRRLRYSLRNAPAELREFEGVAILFRERDRLADLYRTQAATERPKTIRAVVRTGNIIRVKLWKILLAERIKRFKSHGSMIAEARKSFWLSVGIVSFTFLIGVCFFWLASVERPVAGREGGKLPE